MSNVNPRNALSAFATELYRRFLTPPHPPFSILESLLCSFLLFHSRQLIPSPLPVLPIFFEALFSLARIDALHRDRLLTMLLILASTSPQAWQLLHRADTFQAMPQLAQISLHLLIGEWDCPNHNVRATVSDAMKKLCVLFSTEACASVENSPVAMVLRYAKQISEGPDGERKREYIGRALDIVGVEGLGAVDDHEWVEVVQILGSRGWKMPVVRERTNVVIGRRDGSIVVARMRAVVQEVESATVDHLGGMSLVEGGEVNDDLLGEDEIGVFERVKRDVGDGATGSIVSMVRGWVEKGNLCNAAAAYLAAPRVLGRVVEKVDGMGEVVRGMSWQLWSVVDDEIDQSLRDLVCSIEEIAVVLGRLCEDNADRSKVRLKRVALIHPWILRRRVRSLEGVVTTVLHGLADGMEKYEAPGMKVLEVCLEVMGMIEGVANSDVVGELLRFLIGEGRGANGVPDMFGDFSLALFRLLAREPSGKEARASIRLVISGKGTSDRIRQAGSELLVRWGER
eukprot:GFKZ01011749.1.p1 GENE.GFKZ01011749.1~~GFKZ01011749.1.p1  ORF type:complete len:512 (+),score=70.57 GFKZ01011749.1:235-1770(+)